MDWSEMAISFKLASNKNHKLKMLHTKQKYKHLQL